MHIIPTKTYFQGVTKIVKGYKSSSIVYITASRPYASLIEEFKRVKIDSSKMFFIDCSSKDDSSKKLEPKNCISLDGPSSLSTLSISINEALDNIKGKKVLLLDSLSVLLIYHDANTIAKFSTFIVNKMRGLDVDAVILALESDADKEVIKQVESFSDSVVTGGN
jgi:KaiC/GvpD/RAD55 family RecA-like ATPase